MTLQQSILALSKLYIFGRWVNLAKLALRWADAAAQLGRDEAVALQTSLREALAPTAPLAAAPATPASTTDTTDETRALRQQVAAQSRAIAALTNPVNMRAPESAALAKAETGEQEANRYVREGTELARAGRYSEAAMAYANATRLGHPLAFNNLGVLYAKGAGVDQDYGQALQLLERGARLGSATAATNLASLHAVGLAGTPDLPRAVYWYQQAIEQGAKHNPERLAALAITPEGAAATP